MTEQRLTITEFVRGMAWHDIGKPFHLGTGGHIWLGYWLLTEAGCPREALLALTHGGGDWDNLKGALKPYLEAQHTPNALPAVLILANPLDRLSASVYSLLSRQFEHKRFLGRNEESRREKILSSTPGKVPSPACRFTVRLWRNTLSLGRAMTIPRFLVDGMNSWTIRCAINWLIRFLMIGARTLTVNG